jgi:hypothetical protein
MVEHNSMRLLFWARILANSLLMRSSTAEEAALSLLSEAVVLLVLATLLRAEVRGPPSDEESESVDEAGETGRMRLLLC